MLGPVTIQGSGVAALCCAALLGKRGVAVEMRPTVRRAQPVLGVSDETLRVLEGIFERPIGVRVMAAPRRRVVDWQNGAAAVELAHPMLVVREEELLEAMMRAMPATKRTERGAGGVRIVAGGRTPSRRYRFGDRRMFAEETGGEEEGATRMTAGPEGWRFALPLGGRRVLVQSAMCDGVDGTACAPSIRWPLMGDGWFACGSAAMTLDPLCGDGVGYAARSALWLCELLVEMGPEAARGVYSVRLAHAFRAHLAVCLELYGRARFAARWAGELEATERGLAAMDQLLSGHYSAR